jgi:hypothetical protein
MPFGTIFGNIFWYPVAYLCRVQLTNYSFHSILDIWAYLEYPHCWGLALQIRPLLGLQSFPSNLFLISKKEQKCLTFIGQIDRWIVFKLLKETFRCVVDAEMM